MRRHDGPVHSDRICDAAGVQRPCTAEGDEGIVPRIGPAIDRHQPDGVGHVLVRDLNDSPGGGHLIETERLADAVKSSCCPREIQAHLAPKEVVEIEPTEYQVGVARRRGRSRPVPGRRPRSRAQRTTGHRDRCARSTPLRRSRERPRPESRSATPTRSLTRGAARQPRRARGRCRYSFHPYRR